MVNTALIEKTEEWKEHISSLSINTIREKSIGLVNDLTKRFQLRVVNETPDEEEQEKLVTRFRQELELRLKNFFFKYRQNTEKGNLIHKRLLRAFPDIKLKRRTELLEDIRERWNRRKSN